MKATVAGRPQLLVHCPGSENVDGRVALIPEDGSDGVDCGSGDRRLADVAYERIKARIVTLEMRPALTFTETELAEELRVGKTPIREALLRLRLEGMVEAQARSGYRVLPVTLKDARDICELRCVLEGETAGLVASRGERKTEALVAHPRTLLDAASESHAHRWIEEECRFHQRLAQATGNARLAGCLAQTLSHVARLFHVCFALDRRAGPAHDHAALLFAIRDGDAPRARELAIEEAREAQIWITSIMLSSASINTANVDPGDGPAHRFYLDVPRTQPEELHRP